MGKKHGIWFDLLDHLAIHEKVLKQYSWLIKPVDASYSLQRISQHGFEKIKHNVVFETVNGFLIDISKETLISKHDSSNGMTVAFSYNCISSNENYHLRYHSAHSQTYNPKAPWHDKPHRHEYDGKVQRIDVYSHDHRVRSDQGKKYTWRGSQVILQFLEHEDWPFISEFLDEVSILK